MPCHSGGNTLIADVRGYTDIRILGERRGDDAAGECFDKTARLLGLVYFRAAPILTSFPRQG
jgi:N6-L-threonylcarbamoyladenine synthase